MSSPINVGDTVNVVCQGTIPGPPFLDGRTGNGSVGLAPGTEEPFSGTRWRVQDGGNGALALRCLGDLDGVRFLDGRTADGTAGLAPNTDPPFSGTRWQLVTLDGDGTFDLQCLGTIDGPRFLDGRTTDGSVGLAANTDPPFSGTHWRATPIALPTQLDFDFPSITFDNGVPVGGSAHLRLFADGSYESSGHFHDSGATEYNIGAVAAVKDSAGVAYTFQHQGHVSGTFEPGSRDNDWDDNGNHPMIAQHWPDLALGSAAQLQASADLDMVNLTNSVIGALGTVLGVIGIIIAV